MAKKRPARELDIQFRWHWRDSSVRDRSKPKNRPMKWITCLAKNLICRIVLGLLSSLVVKQLGIETLIHYGQKLVDAVNKILPQGAIRQCLVEASL